MPVEKIYILDDEKHMADMLAEFVKLMGYQASIYTRASQFFEENSSFAEGSILILDLIMEEMDGVEVIRELAENGHTLPIILVSGYDSGVLHSAEQLARAHSLDIIATLGKPLQLNVLKDVIQLYAQNIGRMHAQNIGRKVTSSDFNDFQLTVGELKDAIHNKQLVLHYQPQIDIKSGSLAGVEALVRWQHPRYGLIYPNLFISLAEKSGLIGDLTAQVIKQTVEQILSWKAEDLMIRASVNISAENITSLSLPEQLSKMLNNHQLDPSMLTLEVTESALMGELVTSLDILTRLRMKGLGLSIDDFGTGYSSLSQLYRVPFTELKIDQGFVMHMKNDDEARGIVKTCIMLGHELKMKVVAEGVEDKEALLLLEKMGCNIAQGYHIARPMPAGELLNWISSRS